MSKSLRIVIALFLGGILGAATAGTTGAAALVAAIQPIGTLWLNALKMTIIPLVTALLVNGVVGAARSAERGSIAGRSAGWFAGLLVIGTAFGAVVTHALLWLWPVDTAAAAALRQAAVGTVPPIPSAAQMLAGIVPANPFAALAAGDMLPIIVFTLVAALAIARLDAERRDRLADLADAIADAMMIVVGWVLWLAPAGVFVLALDVGQRVGFAMGGMIVHYVAIVSLTLIAQLLFVTYPAAVIAGRIAPMRFARAALPAQAVALGTQSSLATLPAMLASARAMGVPDRSAGISLPLAAALFRITSPAGNLAVVLVVAQLYGVPIGWGQTLIGMAIGIIGSLAVVGVASSASFFVVLVPMSIALGVPIAILPLLLAVEVLPDLWRTVGNVTADLAAAAAVARREDRDATPEQVARSGLEDRSQE